MLALRGRERQGRWKTHCSLGTEKWRRRLGVGEWGWGRGLVRETQQAPPSTPATKAFVALLSSLWFEYGGWHLICSSLANPYLRSRCTSTPLCLPTPTVCQRPLWPGRDPWPTFHQAGNHRTSNFWGEAPDSLGWLWLGEWGGGHGGPVPRCPFCTATHSPGLTGTSGLLTRPFSI